MANRGEHLIWADENFALAENLQESGDPTMKRWAVVAAYYSLLHVAHAIAAEKWGEHPADHGAVHDIPKRVDPTRVLLSAQLKESYMLSTAARYLDDPRTLADRWYEPYASTAAELVDAAITLMRTLKPELERLGRVNP